MRTLHWSLLVAATMISGPAQQEKDQPTVDAKKPPKTLTLVGCVSREQTSRQLTIDDPQSGRYQVNGSRIERYVGQRVEITGNLDSSRLRVKGGLTPTPNIAGQAGAVDPVRAAVAGQPGGGAVGTGDASLPSFRVRSVKTLHGACE